MANWIVGKMSNGDMAFWLVTILGGIFAVGKWLLKKTTDQIDAERKKFEDLIAQVKINNSATKALIVFSLRALIEKAQNNGISDAMNRDFHALWEELEGLGDGYKELKDEWNIMLRG